MSRTLSKILVTCAMIAVFPLIIVGTAFAAYFSIDASVNVGVYTNQLSPAADAYAQVLYNGKANSDKILIKQGHTNTIELKATAKGYDFKGWFAGDKESYAAAHQAGTVKFAMEDDVVTVGMTDYQKLLAVFEIQENEVSYAYKATPDATENTLTTPETDDSDATTRIYYYGENLPTLVAPTAQYSFSGWKVVGDETNTIYTQATFSGLKDITLEAVWNENLEIKVNYYNNKNDEEPLWTETDIVYQNQEYTLKDLETVKSDFAKEAGYAYSWVDGEGNAITKIISKEDVNVYLAKTAISYSAVLTINESDKAFISTNVATDISFTSENMSALESWFNIENWNIKYSFHKFIGIKVGETTYTDFNTFKAVAENLINANPDGPKDNKISAEVVLEKNFTKVEVAEKVSYKLAHAQNPNIAIDNIYTETGSVKDEITGENEVNSIDNILELIHMNENSKFYDADKNAETRNPVVLSRIRVTINGTQKVYRVSANMTVNDLIELIVQDYTLDGVDILTISTVEVIFNRTAVETETPTEPDFVI